MSILEKQIIFDLPGVCAHNVDPAGSSSTTPGVLSLLKKKQGIFIEWEPFQNPHDMIVIGTENRDDSCPNENAAAAASSSSSSSSNRRTILISIDIKDLRSFVLQNEDSLTDAYIKFMAKDGTSYTPFYFTTGCSSDFIAALKDYACVKRSAKEPNLHLIIDEKSEALQQSVSMLFKENSQDLLTKLWNNPYATAISGLGKVTNYLQDHVLSNLVLDDFDPILSEEQRYAMKEWIDSKKQHQDEYDYRNSNDSNGFEFIKRPTPRLPARPIIQRDEPITVDEWQTFCNDDGSMKNVPTLLMKIFRGGLSNDVRKVAWKFLLNVYAWNSTEEERKQLRSDKQEYYYKMKLQWKTISSDQQSRFSEFRERVALIDKDVARTDRTHKFFEGENNANLVVLRDILCTYMMYNFDLGYVQGMSDLLSPLMVVMQNEVDSFWAFVGFMNKVHKNFEMDQKAIKNQLVLLGDLLLHVNGSLANHLESHDSDNMFFCFRWALVLFKREFSFTDIMRLWEVLWTGVPCKNFHLLVCLAILEQQADIIVENKFGFTEILKHVNDLSMRLDLNELLKLAEGIYHQMAAATQQLGHEICDHLGFEYNRLPLAQQNLQEKNLEKIDQWTKQSRTPTTWLRSPGSIERVKGPGEKSTLPKLCKK